MDKYFNKNEIINGYRIIKIIGIGKYGIVYLVTNYKGEKFVLKQLKEDMLEKSREKLFYEEEILKNLNSYYFPGFIDKFKDNYREGYILEYIDGINLEDLIRKYKHKFNRREIYDIGEKLIDIIEELHNNGVVHRDIRIPNVIIDKDRNLFLIDFGLSRYIDKERYRKQTDYWYLGDFLLHLYYSTTKKLKGRDIPWEKELDLTNDEIIFLKRLLGIKEKYKSIKEIKRDFKKIKYRKHIPSSYKKIYM